MSQEKMEQKGKTSLQCLKTAHQLLANLIQIHRVSHHLIGCKQDLMGGERCLVDLWVLSSDQ